MVFLHTDSRADLVDCASLNSPFNSVNNLPFDEAYVLPTSAPSANPLFLLDARWVESKINYEFALTGLSGVP
jgi:hypothetical protein